MAKNIYLKEYIDLYKNEPLTGETFGEPDLALLAMLCLIDVDACCPKVGQRPISFKKVMQKEVELHGVRRYGLLLPMNISHCLYNASLTKRFASLKVHDCFHYLSDEEITQSTFLQIDLDEKTTVIVFGATDDTIVGWKENYEECYGDKPPCVKYASEYAFDTMIPGREYIFVGHSKGGMESLYAGLIQQAKQDQIKAVYDFDGNGFSTKVMKDIKNSPHKNKVVFIVPQSSVVGRLFNNFIEPRVVYSKDIGLVQHNPIGWAIDGKKFKECKTGFSKNSDIIPNAVNTLFDHWDEKTIRRFEKGFFKTISAGGSKTLSECPKHVLEITKEFTELKAKDKILFLRLMRYLTEKRFVTSGLVARHFNLRFKKRDN